MVEPRWEPIHTDENAVRQLQQALGMPYALCRILAQRGISSSEEAQHFFMPSLEQLHDPFSLQDMLRAVERLNQAVKRGERILLYGDYDVDGTTGVAMLYSFLSRIHAALDYYLPDREREGYGVSMEGIAYAQRQGVSLIITIDCGIQAHAAITAAKAAGIDVIVCDHHLPEGEMPPALAVLNPRRPDCTYPNKHLSGCGVAFKLAQAFALVHGVPPEELEDLLDLVALSTCCDLVPLVGENRVLVACGLKRIERHPRLGVWVLVQASKSHTPLSVRDLVFGVGPLINAAGRMADAREAVRLLLAAEKRSATEQAARLVMLNRRRQTTERTATQAALKQLQAQAEAEQRKSIVLFDPAIPIGVVGIVASRMVEHFHKPAIVLTQKEVLAVGSGRSVPGFPLHEALQHCRALLAAFGGHAHAAGVQLPLENVPAFAERFEEVARQLLPSAAERPVLQLVGQINLADITPQFWSLLKQFAPFGPANMTPIFWAANVRDTGHSRLLQQGHVQFHIRQGDGPVFSGVGFGLAERFALLRHQPFDMAFSIEEDNFRGVQSLRLRARALRAPSDPPSVSP